MVDRGFTEVDLRRMLKVALLYDATSYLGAGRQQPGIGGGPARLLWNPNLTLDCWLSSPHIRCRHERRLP
jgi:hypothetical protein